MDGSVVYQLVYRNNSTKTRHCMLKVQFNFSFKLIDFKHLSFAGNCRSYGQNVESAPFLTLGLPRGTLYRKTCVLFLTQCFLGSDWRLTFLVLLLTFVDYCCLCYVMLCNPMLMTLVMHLCSPCNRRTINFYDDDDDDDDLPGGASVHPYLIHASLDPSESTSQTTCQSVQRILQLSLV